MKELPAQSQEVTEAWGRRSDRVEMPVVVTHLNSKELAQGESERQCLVFTRDHP